MKLCLIGDMHVKLDNLVESKKIIDWIVGECKKRDATPVFLGDQYDNMAIIRAEVLEFWVNSYNHINNALSGSDSISSISLTGNHDLNSDSTASAMSAHEKQTTVVGSHISPHGYLQLTDTWAAIGYIRDNDEFVKLANRAYFNGIRTILCHSEFNGCQYDNGYYSPHGIDPNAFPKDLFFISGHIHTAQSFAQVNYIGSPRQFTRSDVGKEKGIVIIDTDTGDKVVLKTPKEVSEPFTSIMVTSEDQIKNIPDSSRVFVDIEGSADFIKKVIKKIPDSVKVRTIPTQERQIFEVKESDGIPDAFAKFSEIHFSKIALTADLKAKVLQKVYEKCPVLRK